MEVDERDGTVPTRFPEHQEDCPPENLGDSEWEDPRHLEMVRCEAYIRLAALDPKQGTFRVRMKCIWAFRTHNSQEDAEIHLRGVPGIRMPGLLEVVEESRVWKDLTFSGSSKTTGKTVFWRGISLFTMDGFKAFQMFQFPFDRHILNLERLEFVWRSEKDDADYFKSMKVAFLTVETSSMLPEWKAEEAYVTALNRQEIGGTSRSRGSSLPKGDVADAAQRRLDRGWRYASKFSVQLRIERKSEFYAWQVFVVTYLITMLSCTPLGMNPESVGDRLSIYVGGMLTLVAFKYGVSDHLPSVPYQTFTDKFLLAQILSVFCCGILTIVSYRIVDDFPDHLQWIDWTENVMGVLLAMAWTTTLAWVSFLKPKPSWRDKKQSWSSIMARDEEARDKWTEEEETRLSAESPAGEAPSGEWPLAGLTAEECKELGLSQDQLQKIAALQAQRLQSSKAA